MLERSLGLVDLEEQRRPEQVEPGRGEALQGLTEGRDRLEPVAEVQPRQRDGQGNPGQGCGTPAVHRSRGSGRRRRR